MFPREHVSVTNVGSMSNSKKKSETSVSKTKKPAKAKSSSTAKKPSAKKKPAPASVMDSTSSLVNVASAPVAAVATASSKPATIWDKIKKFFG